MPARERGRSRLRRFLSLLVAPLVALPLMGAAPGDPARPVVTPAPGAAGAASVYLVTGDQVVMTPAADGRKVAVVKAASRPDGEAPTFQVIEDGDALYVFPSDAQELIPDRLDPELFNITKLLADGYTDGVSVIMTGAGRQAAASTAGLSVTTPLASVNGYAAIVKPGGAWWSQTASKSMTATAGGGKMWLDEITHVNLAESVPMIGAPAAWAAGYDGAGTTVAVLDTGIDATHPDVAGQIAGERNFTTEPDMRDGHGHGTHVASTIAGTGAGSNGNYKGVAPGADLLIGKICNGSGSCPNSSTIAGMQWAAQNADVVSISIGTNTGEDGTGPTAQAVNQLTQQYDTLFVIAAANNGTQGAGSIGAPGSADAALTVGAVDKTGALASFSSRGPRLNDFAIKPDITAPGVGIAAARAAGTAMGTPVNDLYTRANGTSMATPHVSGAAAIVLQKYPDLGAGQLKALLAGTATRSDDLSVYQQGGGLTNIPAALAAPVIANPAPLNLGFFRYGGDTRPVTKTVTYTNRTDAQITLNLALQVTDAARNAVPASAVAVSPATVTVPARGTATADVTVHPADLATGSYGGYLVADSAAGQVHTSVGFTLEAEMYDVVINGITRTGKPASTGSSLHIRQAVDTNRFAKNSLQFSNGAVRLRVPPGSYNVNGTIGTLDGSNTVRQNRTFVSIPTLDVTGNTTVTLDARQANEMTFEAPEHPEARPFDQSRLVYHFEAEQNGDITATWLGPWEPTYVLPADAPTVGGNAELYVNARVGDAPLVLQVAEPSVSQLHPRQLTGSPALDSDRRLPLVYAGNGAEADYAGLDVTGKIVLTDRAGPAFAAKEATASARGAAALLIMNNTAGTFTGTVPGAQIPTLSISGEEGIALRDLLAGGPVTLRLAGTPFSPYLYDLFVSEQDRIPADQHHTVRTSELATLHNSFYGTAGTAFGEYRAAWRPYMGTAPVQYSQVRAASQRVEYVTADDTKFRQLVATGGTTGSVQERDVVYAPGDVDNRDWFKGAVRPGILEPLPPYNPGYPATRTGNTMSLQVMEWMDSTHYGVYSTTYDTGQFRAFQDGVQFGQAPWPRVSITNLDPAPHTYRFEVDMTRTAPWWPTSTATSTAWTITSEAAATRQVLPFLLVDYDTQLDLTNTATHPSDRTRPATLDLKVRHQAGSTEAAIAGAKVWVSYDDGVTWESRPVKDGGDGRFQATLSSRDAEDTSGFVTVKVEAWDTADNRVEQQISRAWRLAAR